MRQDEEEKKNKGGHLYPLYIEFPPRISQSDDHALIRHKRQRTGGGDITGNTVTSTVRDKQRRVSVFDTFS